MNTANLRHYITDCGYFIGKNITGYFAESIDGSIFYGYYQSERELLKTVYDNIIEVREFVEVSPEDEYQEEPIYATQ